MYPTIIPLITRICFDIGLKERLRCEYLTQEHERRPDFPPDVVLRDQKSPGVVLLDLVLANTAWALDFGQDITVSPWSVIQAVAGVVLNDGWYLAMREGQIVVQREKPPGVLVYNLAQAGWSLEVNASGELVYTYLADVLIRDQITAQVWGLRFWEENVTVEEWPEPTQPIYAGVRVNDGWYIVMREGEIVATPFWPGEVTLEVFEDWPLQVNSQGEIIYTPKSAPVGQEFFSVAWALYFREEITVFPWPYRTPINGWVLNGGWVLKMQEGEMVLTQTPVPVPYISRQQERWWFSFYVDQYGELKYTPYNRV